MTACIIQGDMLKVLPTMAADSVHAVVCDPPYHLTSTSDRFGSATAAPAKFGTDGAYARASRGFMGQTWDGGDIAMRPETWEEVLRVMKPGAHLVAFGGSRTYHRIACAIEDAGFELRDSLMWLYGSGFPKSHDVERGIAEILCELPGRHYGTELPSDRRPDDHICPAHPLSEPWDGFGSALKPSFEPIILARKPLIGTIAANTLLHRVGGINIDGCRVPHTTVDGGSLATNPHLRTAINAGNGGHIFPSETDRRVVVPDPAGRFPANTLHDGSDEVLEAFAAFGKKTSGKPGVMRKGKNDGACYGAESRQPGTRMTGFGDSGTAARFFYCAKANKADRAGSEHPTVKPIALMRWLARLVTPPGGVVLDPFAGSGSTGAACVREGFDVIMVEQSADYVADICRRMTAIGK